MYLQGWTLDSSTYVMPGRFARVYTNVLAPATFTAWRSFRVARALCSVQCCVVQYCALCGSLLLACLSQCPAYHSLTGLLASPPLPHRPTG